MDILDMRGKPCPIPVVKAKRALEHPETTGVAVLVDNLIAVQNLEKMAVGTGYDVSYTERNGDHCVTLSKRGEATPLRPVPIRATGDTLLIGTDRLGQGDDDLGKILLKGFLFSLTEIASPPSTVILLNSGVHLAAKGSNMVDDLQTLVAVGTEIMVCGTCAQFYGIQDSLAVGTIRDMMEIATALSEADKVVSLG